MITHSSSTAADTSNVDERVARAIEGALAGRTDSQAARVEQLRVRIQNLEARGFIKRQEFAAPTTADFERRLFHKTG
jgi:hypothetical protein